MENKDEEINYFYELNNADIVREVIAARYRFSLEILCHFKKTIQETLASNNIGDWISREEHGNAYFDNYINIRIPRQKELMSDPFNGPIPDFFVLPCKIPDTIHIVDSEEDFIVDKENSHYGHYLAFKLALIPGKSFFPLLQFHMDKYFAGNILEFTNNVKLILADFKDIIGDRAAIVLEHIAKLSSGSSGTEKELLADAGLETELEDSIENTNHRQQVIAIKHLLSVIYKNAENKPEDTEIAKFIAFLTGKNNGKRIKDTNTYKMLKKPLVSTERVNIQNLGIIRGYFVHLMIPEAISMVDKEIKSIN